MNYDYSRALHVGKTYAEADWDDLKDHFVEIDAFSQVGSPNPLLLVGRKGSGKTSMRMYYEWKHSGEDRVFSIEPSYDDVGNIFAHIRDSGLSDRTIEFVAKLWEFVVCVNVVQLIIRSKAESGLPDISGLPLDFLNSVVRGEKFGLGRALNEIRNRSWSYNDLDDHLRSCRRYIRTRISAASKPIVVFVDSLDEVILSGEPGKRSVYSDFFDGLLTFFRAFYRDKDKTISSIVKIQIFLPADVYRISFSHHLDQYGIYSEDVRWGHSELSHFMTVRLIDNIKPAALRRKFSQNYKLSKDPTEVWNHFFPPEYKVEKALPGSRPIVIGAKTLGYLSSLTLRRPRDFQRLIGEIASVAAAGRPTADGTRFPNQNDIDVAVRRYSEKLLETVIDEYALAYSKIETVLLSFTDSAAVIGKNEVIEILERTVGTSRSEIDRAVECLFEAGVIGALRGTTYTGPEDSEFVYEMNDFKLFWERQWFVIHRAFWSALRVRAQR